MITISQIHDIAAKIDMSLSDRLLSNDNVKVIKKLVTANTSFTPDQITWETAVIHGVGEKQMLCMFGSLVDDMHPGPIPVNTQIPMKLVHFGSEQVINDYFTLMNTSKSDKKGVIH